MIQIKGAYKVGKLDFSSTTFFLQGTEPFIPDSEDFIIGSDYATIAVTTDLEVMKKALSLITDDDLVVLENEGFPSFTLFEGCDLYILSAEFEYLNDEARDFIYNNLVLFGAEMDDIDLPTCIPAGKMMNSKNWTPAQLDDYFQNFEPETEEDYELETALDFLSRIFEYNPKKEQHKEIRLIFEKLPSIDTFFPPHE